MSVRIIGEIIATRHLYYFDEMNQKKTISVVVGFSPHQIPGISMPVSADRDRQPGYQTAAGTTQYKLYSPPCPRPQI
jgi:hypothetical protein